MELEEKLEKYIKKNKLSSETAEQLRANIFNYEYVPTIFEKGAA